jgi:short-subunit dehydrogenase
MKTAVITGATSGIGNLVLKKFLKAGYTVFAGYREVRQKKILAALSPNVIPFRIDLTKKWTIDESIKIINESVEKIDVLVNAAGMVVAGPLETIPISKIREQFEVNTFAHLEFSQGLFEKLNGGKIINISSMASYGIFPFLAPYCASKKALDILFNSLRIETGSKVKIISVKPGVIATPLWQKSIDNNKDNLGSGKYKAVGDFLISNAAKNANNGLNPNIVADKILEIAESKNPKNSYTIGLDAFGARLVSKIPQGLLDFLVEGVLIKRVKHHLNKISLLNNINKANIEVDTATLVDNIFSLNAENPEAKLKHALKDAIDS